MANKNKYQVDMSEKGKSKRTVNGILFDSELEAKYYKEVILTDKTITNYKIQPKYQLQGPFGKYMKKHRPIFYVADFEIERGFKVTVVDVKGMATEAAKLKRKWFDKKYPEMLLEWVSFSKMDGGWIGYDELQKLRRERKKAKK